MAYKLILLPAVENDISSVIEWYEAANADLSRQFIDDLDNVFKNVLFNPFLYQVVFKEYRGANARRFPYKIIYRISGESIVVLAVVHHRRSPRTWKKRI